MNLQSYIASMPGLINKIRRGEKEIWAMYILLSIISLLEVFSAASKLAYKTMDYIHPIVGHRWMMVAGFVALLVANVFSMDTIKRVAATLTICCCFILMGMTFGLIGKDMNGATRWLEVGQFTIQPSEFIKLFLIAAVARYITLWQDEDGLSTKALWHSIVLIVVTCLFIAIENLSTAILVSLTMFWLLLFGRIKWKHVLKIMTVLAVLAALGVTLLLVTPDEVLETMGRGPQTWKTRITTFSGGAERVPAKQYNIQDNPQLTHAYIAIARSHLYPTGPGTSVERNYLDVAYADFIYAITVEELGLILGSVLIVLIYLRILVRTVKIAQRCDDYFQSLLIIGAALIMMMQAFMHMCVCVGIIPVTGQTLPLISRGGSAMIVNGAFIGLILNVSAYVKSNQAAVQTATVQTETEMEN